MINKYFVSLYTLLSANPDMKVSEILPQCEELMTSEVSDKITRIDEYGILWIFCWYHKVWESTSEIEYGSKASNKSTGLNTFCKVGVNCWTKQQRDFKTASSQLLIDVQAGNLKPEDITTKLNDLGIERDKIESRDDYFARKEVEKEAKAKAQAS